MKLKGVKDFEKLEDAFNSLIDVVYLGNIEGDQVSLILEPSLRIEVDATRIWLLAVIREVLTDFALDEVKVAF